MQRTAVAGVAAELARCAAAAVLAKRRQVPRADARQVGLLSTSAAAARGVWGSVHHTGAPLPCRTARRGGGAQQRAVFRARTVRTEDRQAWVVCAVPGMQHAAAACSATPHAANTALTVPSAAHASGCASHPQAPHAALPPAAQVVGARRAQHTGKQPQRASGAQWRRNRVRCRRAPFYSVKLDSARAPIKPC